MPALTRWYIKASFIYLMVALVFGLGQVAGSFWNLPPIVNAFGPVYLHFFMVGWVTQLIFGVVFWMFPKYSLGRPRGNEKLAWLTFWLLNAGLWLRFIGEPAISLSPASGWGWLLVISAFAQWFAGLLFVAISWPRVKGR